MSSLPIDRSKATDAEISLVRAEGERRRRQLLYGWDREPVGQAQIAALVRSTELEFTIEGGPPASIAYLHSLITNGMADRYDWHEREFEIKINWADKAREPNLAGVDSVVLRYREGV